MLKDWKAQGKTHAFVAGRFQPPHDGHFDLFGVPLSTGLKLKVLVQHSSGDDRNPLSYEQRKEMILAGMPSLKPEDIFYHKSSLSNLDQLVDQVLHAMSQQAKLEDSVFFYMRKPEDIKTYRFRGKEYPNSHYADFLTKPTGPLDAQLVTPEMVNGRVFHATQIRNDLEHHLTDLPPELQKRYVIELAAAYSNNRPVGGDKSQDRPIVDATQPPHEGEPVGDFQLRMLKERGKDSFIIAVAPLNGSKLQRQ